MPSATSAERSDSMPASSAIESAGEKSCGNSAQSKRGRCGTGSDVGTLPKREPTVSTGSEKSETATVVTSNATSGPGTRVETRGHKATIATVAAQSAAAVASHVPRCAA